jgi:ArsR family transcriptional regulator, arsenate/arsenite/antimonite-responsive transcriptional repressor / arsenate reductase (thioredoxin)
VAATAPPSFLALAGHPLRWQLLTELARSDRRVRELCELVAQPQALVSYHLGKLRSERLVSMRRSIADGRDVYYSLDLARCGTLLTEAGTALHPGLGPPPSVAPAPDARHLRLLFLCTGNSARSQMAEALATRLGGGSVEAFSAGSAPKPLRPEAVRVMRERGIDIAGRRSKHLHELAGERFDCVITLCDRVREVCPEFPASPEAIHWSIPDPARDDDPGAFDRVADELAARIPFLLTLAQEAA